MTDVLVILDGASEPIDGEAPTSLERAGTPVLDALAQLGTLTRLATTPDGLSPGSEVGCSVLLGWSPDGPVDRAALEAAAHGIELGDDEVARRIDVLERGGTRGEARHVDAVIAAIEGAGTGARAHRIGGHRVLLTGTEAAVAKAVRTASVAAPSVRRWAPGVVPPRVLGPETVVVAAPGAVLGLARLLGARGITPPGYGGGARAPLDGMAELAVALLEAAADAEEGSEAGDGGPGHAPLRRLVLHVDGPDEAAHERDPGGKVAALEAADEELLLPVVAALHALGGTLEIAIDHGCSPVDGEHDGEPTPALRWIAGEVTDDVSGDDPATGGDGPAGAPGIDFDPDAPGVHSGLDPEDLPVMALPKRRAHATAQTGRRLTERWVLPLPVEVPPALAGGPPPDPTATTDPTRSPA